MMLGKRGRPMMKRTTSMKGFEFENEPPPPSQRNHQRSGPNLDGFNQFNGYGHMLSPRNFTSADIVSSLHGVEETADFLSICGLCGRRLVPGRDIYMYRGDTAFCSLECREDKIKQDDKNGEASHHSPSSSESTGNNNVAAALQY